MVDLKIPTALDLIVNFYRFSPIDFFQLDNLTFFISLPTFQKQIFLFQISHFLLIISDDKDVSGLEMDWYFLWFGI